LIRYTDIRFWIILFAIIRLVNITLPPVEVGHNWRQSTVLMVARNFFEGPFDLMHPKVDMAGDLSGVTGMEFPLLNALHAGCARLLGWSDWYGRLIVLIFSSFALWSLFSLLIRVIDRRWARDSVLILTTSLWFIYSRKIMPDAFSCSLVIIGTHLLVKSWETGNRARKIIGSLLASCFIVLGLLSKLPAGILLLGMLPFLPQLLPNQRHLWTFAWFVPGAALVMYWYYFWVPHLVTDYGFWHFFMGKSMGIGALELAANWQIAAMHVIDHALKFTGFGCFLAGLVLLFRTEQHRVLMALLFAFFGLIIVAIKAGDTFVRHDYYILPFVPFMAIAAAFALQKIPVRRWRIAALALVMLEGLANQAHDFFPSSNQRAILRLESALDAVSNPDDLIVINCGPSPTPLYFAHRKGWVLSGIEIESSRQELIQKGATHIVWLQQSWKSGALPEGSAHSSADPPWFIESLIPSEQD